LPLLTKYIEEASFRVPGLLANGKSFESATIAQLKTFADEYHIRIQPGSNKESMFQSIRAGRRSLMLCYAHNLNAKTLRNCDKSVALINQSQFSVHESSQKVYILRGADFFFSDTCQKKDGHRPQRLQTLGKVSPYHRPRRASRTQ
jgi:hypothetical protein